LFSALVSSSLHPEVFEDVLDGPVLHFQTMHAPEFPFIVSHQCQIRRQGVRSNPKIAVSDHLTPRFEMGTNGSVGLGCGVR